MSPLVCGIRLTYPTPGDTRESNDMEAVSLPELIKLQLAVHSSARTILVAIAAVQRRGSLSHLICE